MNKSIMLGMVFCALLLITSCVPVAKYYVCSDGKQVADPTKCVVETNPEPVVTPPANETKPVEETKPVVVIKDISADAQALIDKSSKVNALQFLYVDSNIVSAENVYYASRDNMKITLKTKAKFSPTESYDTIYYDFTALSAFAYCENADKSICPDRNKKFNIDFANYLIKTPFDWLKELEKASLTGKSKMIEGRNAKEMTFEINGTSGTMFIDSYYGMPLTISYDGVTYEYRNMVINEATDKDLTHQTLSNI